MKLIMNADLDEFGIVVDLAREAKPKFDAQPERLGWGWIGHRSGSRSFYIRQIKGGMSIGHAAGTAPIKLIINAELDEMEYVLALIQDAKPLFDGRPSRPGWGWTFSQGRGRVFFIREIKGGLSVNPARSGNS